MRQKEITICPECEKPTSKSSGECLICQKKFHNHCLYKVKLDNGKTHNSSYYICRKCKRKTDTDRKILREPRSE